MFNHVKSLIGKRLASPDPEVNHEAVEAVERYEEVLTASNTGIFEWDLVDHKFYGTSRTFEIFGLDQSTGWIDETPLLDVMPNNEAEKLLSFCSGLGQVSEVRKLETFCTDAKNTKVFIEMSAKAVKSDEDDHYRVIGSVTDVSEQRKLEHRLRHEALHDFLTGLPNRTLLVDRIQHILTRLKRNSDLNAA